MTRDEMLTEAIRLTTGDRNASYGHPYDNLTMMANMVSAYLSGKCGIDLAFDAEDMAWIMVMAKASRTIVANKGDNYIDAAAYAAIAGECRHILENCRLTD